MVSRIFPKLFGFRTCVRLQINSSAIEIILDIILLLSIGLISNIGLRVMVFRNNLKTRHCRIACLSLYVTSNGQVI